MYFLLSFPPPPPSPPLPPSLIPHQRHDRPAEGLAALEGRYLSYVAGHGEVFLPGHPSRRGGSTLCGYPLDQLPLGHRFRAVSLGIPSVLDQGSQRSLTPGGRPLADRGAAPPLLSSPPSPLGVPGHLPYRFERRCRPAPGAAGGHGKVRSHFKRMTTVGEPIESNVWRSYTGSWARVRPRSPNPGARSERRRLGSALAARAAR